MTNYKYYIMTFLNGKKEHLAPPPLKAEMVPVCGHLSLFFTVFPLVNINIENHNGCIKCYRSARAKENK